MIGLDVRLVLSLLLSILPVCMCARVSVCVRACTPSPTPAAYIHSNQIMGWGEKAIEIRSVETGHLDGVFMHKRAQRLKFLSERNDKVSASEKTPAHTCTVCVCKCSTTKREGLFTCLHDSHINRVNYC